MHRSQKPLNSVSSGILDRCLACWNTLERPRHCFNLWWCCCTLVAGVMWPWVCRNGVACYLTHRIKVRGSLNGCNGCMGANVRMVLYWIAESCLAGWKTPKRSGNWVNLWWCCCAPVAGAIWAKLGIWPTVWCSQNEWNGCTAAKNTVLVLHCIV